MEALRHDHTMSNAIPMRAKTHVRLIGRSTPMVALQAEIDRVVEQRVCQLQVYKFASKSGGHHRR